MKFRRISALVCGVVTILTARSHAQNLLTKYGDNVSTLDGIIKAYYDVVSIKKGGQISYERDSLLHIPNVRVASAGVDQKGNPVLLYTSLREYHRQSDAYMEKTGFYEHETSRTVQQVRNLYHVWSAYESRSGPGEKVIAAGINSIDLYFDGKRFWILGWFYD